MNPHDLGFPKNKFNEFRPAQLEAFQYVLTSDKRVSMIGAPTGVGKSGIAYGIARLLGGRVNILTANTGLEDQYVNDGFEGLVNVRGQANYECWEGGTCADGKRLGCGDRDSCPYSVAREVADYSEIVVQNYAYWLQSGAQQRPFETLILDEAHLAFEWLCRAVDFEFTDQELQRLKLKIKPHVETDFKDWQTLVQEIRSRCETMLVIIKARVLDNKGVATYEQLHDLRLLDSLIDRCNRMQLVTMDNWVITYEPGTNEGRRWSFNCIWPGRYREMLFRRVPRIIMLSATLRPKDAYLLGIPKNDFEFKEWPRQFPFANGPVYYLPTAAVGYNMSAQDTRVWLDTQKTIVNHLADRKGIIHTVSYQRAAAICEDFGAKYNLILNGINDPASPKAIDAYQRFVKSAPGAVLISPSFGTGWDFSGKKAEYQIICKIPFGDTRSELMQRRLKTDPQFANHKAAQELAQACGRINRYHDDLGQTFILDDNWKWFSRAASASFSRSFKVVKIEQLPKKLPKII